MLSSTFLGRSHDRNKEAEFDSYTSEEENDDDYRRYEDNNRSSVAETWYFGGDSMFLSQN